ncbi:MAG: SMC family ATPase [Actinomycetaceae bacterium]|nr:SMC family ATPase [Actinomycetaceae bacterium]
MRLRRLELSGIGPFKATHAIDFDRLTAGGLFLLEGPTGSGKSTIIDAITWGLYGSVAGGSDSTDERMRSTHAEPNAQSYVDLVFSVEAGTFRIRRTPQWTKPGNKNPTNATAKLWRLSEAALEEGQIDHGEVVSTKAREVGSEVAGLIGLNRDQFVQTIVLPQGKFAEFLRLRSDERTKLLEQIFDTSIYRLVTDELKERAKQAGSSVDEARQAWLTSVSTCVAALEAEHGAAGESDEGPATGEAPAGDATPADGRAHAAGGGPASGAAGEAAPSVRQDATVGSQSDDTPVEELATQATEPQDAPDVAAVLAARVDAAEREAAEAGKISRRLAEQATRTAEELREAEELARRLATREQLLGRQRELDARKEAIGGLRQSLDLHDEAGRVAAYVEASERAQTRLGTARAGVEAFGLQPAQVGEELVASTQSQIDELTQSLGALAEVARLEEDLSRARAKQAEREARLTELLASIKAAEQREAALPERLQDVNDRIAASQSIALGLDRHKADVERLTRLRAKLGELRQARTERDAALAEARDAASAFSRAKGESDTVTRAWLESVSAILAVELADDSPCPVCGSRDHPSPAPESSVRATRAEVDEAEEVTSRARQALDAAQRKVDVTASRVLSIEEEVGETSPDEVDEALATARRAVEESRRAGTELEGLRGDMERLHEESEAARKRRQDDAEAQASLRSAIESAGASIAEDAARVESELRGYASVAQRRRATEAAISGQRERLAAFRALIAALEACSERAAELEQALLATPFATADEVRAARQTPEAAARARADVDAHDRAVEEVAHALCSPEIAALTGDEVPRVDEHVRRAEAAHTRAEAAQKRATLAEDRARRSAGQLETVVARARSWSAAKQAAGPVVRLASLATAGAASITRVPLATFVLQQRFEQIVTSANERLAEISLGRYQLARREDQEKGSREMKTGLGLVVIDRDGEASGSTERSTRSLSGGETFYVSLALALALADVVRAENGGIQLETLLIDEGFGSLDEDTLGLVMNTLKGLTRETRSVGLVSHVSEMKKMIAEQVTVRPLADGSSRLDVRC